MAEVATYTSVSTEIRKKKIAPVYLLHGEEGYYIDRLAAMLADTVAPEDRDFNLYTMYGPEVSPDDVIDACRQYPMTGDRVMVILREAQSAKLSGGRSYLGALASYIANPSPMATLVICYRGAKFTGKEVTDAVRKCGGVIFEAKKLKDRALAAAIADFVKERGLSVGGKALEMLTEYVGSDMSRIDNEVAKLTVTLGKGATITPEVIERNIGFSKDYNNFELKAALGRRDTPTALRIIKYFAANPKANPVQMTIPTIFGLFQDTLIGFYSTDKTKRGIAQFLGFQWESSATDIINAMGHYNAWEVIEIIDAIRRCDAATKGVDSRFDPYDLLFDLVVHILNPIGHR